MIIQTDLCNQVCPRKRQIQLMKDYKMFYAYTQYLRHLDPETRLKKVIFADSLFSCTINFNSKRFYANLFLPGRSYTSCVICSIAQL